ncbi:MAG: circadian clock KaiB family protein [Cyanobacteriota bacterium]|nr:circadian clock KaiB family protein [Cyanobacteriota bacterium]
MQEKQTDKYVNAIEYTLEQQKNAYYHLRLYVARTLPSSTALANIKKICNEYLSGRHRLEIIDIYEQPERLHDENIVAIPTLIKISPEPSQRLIGNLSDKTKVIMRLGLV